MRRKFRASFLNLLATLGFSLAFIYCINYFSELDAALVQELIMKTEAPLFFLSFLSFLFLATNARKKIAAKLELKKADLSLILLIFILAFLVRELIPPKTHRLFFDEDIYMDMAKQISINFQSCLCNYGNSTTCFKCEVMKWPVGHPFLLAIPFTFFGFSNGIATHTMIFMSSLTTVFIYLSAYLLFRKKAVAFFSAFIFTLLPIHILWSTTTTADLTFSFFISLALFFIILSSYSENFAIEVVALLALVLTVQAKAEAVILLLLYWPTKLLIDKKFLKKFSEKKYPIAFAVTLLLLTPFFVHVFHAGKYDPWGAGGKKFGLRYFKDNLLSNLNFWFETYWVIQKDIYFGKQLFHPLLFTIFGLLSIHEWRNRTHLTLLLWFFSLFLLYCFFYAGSVLYGVDVRYVLPQYMMFSLIAGCGAWVLYVGLAKKLGNRLSLLVLLIIIVGYFLKYLPWMLTPASEIEEASDAILYRNFAVNFARKVPNDCYFVSHVTSLYSMLGKGYIQIWYVYRPEFDEMIKNKCVIFDEGYWCAIHVPESKSCVELGKKFKLELLERFDDTRHNKVYSFYRLVSL